MKKKTNRVTFEELTGSLSHYEITFLAYCKSLEILRSGRSLLGNDRYKPKVALVALEELCSNLNETLIFKEELKNKIFLKSSETSDFSEDEDYIVDEEIETFAEEGTEEE